MFAPDCLLVRCINILRVEPWLTRGELMQRLGVRTSALGAVLSKNIRSPYARVQRQRLAGDSRNRYALYHEPIP